MKNTRERGNNPVGALRQVRQGRIERKYRALVSPCQPFSVACRQPATSRPLRQIGTSALGHRRTVLVNDMAATRSMRPSAIRDKSRCDAERSCVRPRSQPRPLWSHPM